MSTLESIDQIEKELTRLYEEKGEPCRASLFNLVVWAPSDERATYLFNLVEPLTEKFPCRVIFISKTSNPKLEIEVSINLKPNVTCDFIYIRTPENELNKIPYLLLPQFLPDLPIYLLWGQNPTVKNELYDLLFPYTSRILFDSSCVKDINSFKQALLGKPQLKLRDINWGLLTGWRRVIARTLDSPEKVASVQNATSINISYCEGACNIQALFLKGWLISKLSVPENIFSVTPTKCEIEPGDIEKLEIHGSHHDIYFARRKNQIMLHLSTQDACDLPLFLPLTNVQRGFNFWRELLFEPLSPDYDAMLAKLLLA